MQYILSVNELITRCRAMATHIYLCIASVGDIHSPRYLHLFSASVNAVKMLSKKIDLIILTGDVVEKNSIDNLKPVITIVSKLNSDKHKDVPIIAVFGNEEYTGFEQLYKQKYSNILWLDDEYVTIRIEEIDVCIAGSRGVLKKPTTWQRKNILNIDELYSSRLEKIKNMLKICRNHKLSILVTHYASTFLTLQGEPRHIYDFLGYPLIENIDSEIRPKIAIHGHAHNSTKVHTVIGSTEIYNVSLPATKRITLINVTI